MNPNVFSNLTALAFDAIFKYTRADGSPGRVENPIVWTDRPDVATVTLNDDGLGCRIVTTQATGLATIFCKADADLTESEHEILISGQLQIIEAMVTGGGISFSQPVVIEAVSGGSIEITPVVEPVAVAEIVATVVVDEPTVDAVVESLAVDTTVADVPVDAIASSVVDAALEAPAVDPVA